VFPALKWHEQQFAEPKRSTTHLAAFAARHLPVQEVGTALDAASGAGANMLHLSETFPAARWTGVELTDEPLRVGREYLGDERFELLQGDIYDLPAAVGNRRFDVSFSIQTLSWLDDYEKPIEQMMAVTDGWIVASSLFSESYYDAFVRVANRGDDDEPDHNYNVYSLPRLESFVRGLGAREFVAERFEIDVDLEPPTDGGMGTWTERTADGRRLQFSGPLHMPWWYVAVRL
jgi:hypothetical protein